MTSSPRNRQDGAVASAQPGEHGASLCRALLAAVIMMMLGHVGGGLAVLGGSVWPPP
jgi:hypothetical protein